jgi:hypothetical protein
VKTLIKSGLQLVLRIYLPSRQIAMPQIGAALWILVEKEDFIRSRAKREIPVSILKRFSQIACLRDADLDFARNTARRLDGYGFLCR